MPDRPAQIVDVMEGGDVPFPLPRHDRRSRDLVGPRAQRGVVHADDRLDVVAGAQRLRHGAGRRTGEPLPLRRLGPVIFDIGVGLGIGRRPLGGVGFERPLAADERGLRRQRHQFRRGGAPIVEHPLRVLGVPHQAAQPPPAIHMQLIPIDRHDRNELAGPVHGLQHLGAGHDQLLDFVRRHAPRPPHDADAQGVEHGLLVAIDLLVHHLAIGQGEDRAVDRLAAPMLRHHHPVAIQPGCGEAQIAVRGPVHRLGALPPRLERRLGQGVDHEGGVPVRAVRRRGIGVAIDREWIGHPLDHQVLVEAVVRRIAGVDPEIAEPAGHREIEGGVIGHLGIRRLLDIADQPVEDLRRLRISPVVHRMAGDRRLVLPRVIDHLADEGRQPVDGQAGPPVQLPVPPHLVRPLLAQPREPDVIQRFAPVLRLVLSRQVERLAGVFEDVFGFHAGPFTPASRGPAAHGMELRSG